MNNNVMNMMNQFRQNPLGMLMQMYKIPQNLNNPQAIVQHLLNSGQITQEQVNFAMSMRNNPMFRGL